MEFNSMKSAFDKVTATDALKEKTLAYLQAQPKKPSISVKKRLMSASVAAAAMIAIAFGATLYFTPISFISLDVNPSVQLSLNRFDRVVDIEGFGEEGTKIAREVNVMHMGSQGAIETVLNKAEPYITEEAVVKLTVASDDEARADELITAAQSMNTAHNFTCTNANIDHANDASAHHMSIGKYESYLLLAELYPDIKPEEVQAMPMWQINALLSGEEGLEGAPNNGHHGGGGNGNGMHGQGNNGGNGSGNGFGGGR